MGTVFVSMNLLFLFFHLQTRLESHSGTPENEDVRSFQNFKSYRSSAPSITLFGFMRVEIKL
jgi:hypothetical protein